MIAILRVLMVSAATLGLVATAGCEAATAVDETDTTDYEMAEAESEESVEQDAQPLASGCTVQGSGGSTWNNEDVIQLCAWGSLSVQKYSGNFTSWGTMYLKNSFDKDVASMGVAPGLTAINFGWRPSGKYRAVYKASSPYGEAWSGWIQN